MKKRLLSALLACMLILIGSAWADGVETTSLTAGQIAVFDDCVVSITEISWYGGVESNKLTPMANGAPYILAIRAQVLNRGAYSRDLILDSSIRVRFGTAYDQAGVVAAESYAGADGLYFVRSSSIVVGSLQLQNIVAYVSITPMMYYSSSQLKVQLTLCGHAISIPLGGSTAPTVTGQPVTAAPVTAAPNYVSTLKILVSYIDENSKILMNTTYLEVPVGGTASLAPLSIAGYTYDHYRYLSNGQWQNGYGSSIQVSCDPYGTLDKQQIYLIYRSSQPVITPAPVPASTPGQAVRPYAWDTQFKPGTSTAPNGEGDNANVYQKLANLYDDNANTSLTWLLYASERSDGIPEFTISFNNATISAIGIRNGKVTSEAEYYAYARLASLRVTIHTASGGTYNTWIYLKDQYSHDYQILSMDRTYTDVTSIELWLERGGGQGFYTGKDQLAFTIHVTDIQFYSGASSQTPYDWNANSY